MRSSAARCFGTAHSLYPAKICYRYHPCHGVDVELIRYLRRGGDAPIVIVRLPDGLQLAIPEWMLSPEICERLRTEAGPRISLDALIELRTLIDAQLSMVAGDRRGCAESSAGGQDAQPREAGRAAAQAHFEDDELWTMFPEEMRERCRGLWQEMLASVLKGREWRPDERED